MPETLRLPAVDFRVLWTVIQLPICAVVSTAQIGGWLGSNEWVTLAELENLLPNRTKKIRFRESRNKVLTIVFAPLTVLGQSPAWSTRHRRE